MDDPGTGAETGRRLGGRRDAGYGNIHFPGGCFVLAVASLVLAVA
ncbi:hypothetical protein ACGFRG_18865 [Streptomyces sp. NPDC048696]